MKPDLNTALMFCAQEIGTLFLPLLEKEYDQSRLGSWGGLMLLSSLQIDGAADNLNKQNKLMMEWLKRSKKSIQSKTLIQKIEECESTELPDIKISTLDNFNQKIRQIFVEAQEHLEESKDSKYLKESWIVLREMHGHRKVSHMLDLLKPDS
jgi:hypothetical protein